MSPVKEAVIILVESLPDDSSIEDIQCHLYVRDKILRGSQAIDAGSCSRMPTWGGNSTNGPHHMD